MPKNFTAQVLGEGAVRAFRWDFETKTLSTDWEVDDPAFAGKKQAEVQITENNFQENPDYTRFWEATATHRIAFELCENEGMSMDDALSMAEKMNGNGAPPSAPQNLDVVPFENPNPGAERVSLQVESEPEPETNPMAGIVITNQQLILSMAFKLLEQYVPEDDPNSGMVELLKAKSEEIDGYEVVI